MFNIWDAISYLYTICADDINISLEAQHYLVQFRIIILSLRAANEYFSYPAMPTTVAATWTQSPPHPQPLNIAFATTVAGAKGAIAAARRDFMKALTDELKKIPPSRQKSLTKLDFYIIIPLIMLPSSILINQGNLHRGGPGTVCIESRASGWTPMRSQRVGVSGWCRTWCRQFELRRRGIQQQVWILGMNQARETSRGVVAWAVLYISIVNTLLFVENDNSLTLPKCPWQSRKKGSPSAIFDNIRPLNAISFFHSFHERHYLFLRSSLVGFNPFLPYFIEVLKQFPLAMQYLMNLMIQLGDSLVDIDSLCLEPIFEYKMKKG